MAGHSKWANIQHRKGAQDKKRSKIYTKLIRELTIAARTGGGDPDANSRLRLAVDKALSNNMPRDNIDRAIKRGCGDAVTENLEEVRYEGYAPGGVAILVDCLTDNRNRTVAEVRHAFTRAEGSLGSDGSVAYLFNKRGIIEIAGNLAREEEIMLAALDAGADDVATDTADNKITVTTDIEHFAAVKAAIAKLQDNLISSAELTMLADLSILVDDIETAKAVLQLIDTLEDLDDVQNVYSNVEISSAVWQQLAD